MRNWFVRNCFYCLCCCCKPTDEDIIDAWTEDKQHHFYANLRGGGDKHHFYADLRGGDNNVV